MICGKPAEFSIKGSSSYYCKECADENFSNLELLQKIEEQARKLKKVVEDKTTE